MHPSGALPVPLKFRRGSRVPLNGHPASCFSYGSGVSQWRPDVGLRLNWAGGIPPALLS